VVTVLFCDLVGFTASSDQADPEDVRARIRPYHARLRQEIQLYGGTVEKFIGDAVMAVFGAPTAHEDDPERAVRAGLQILEAISDLNAADPELDLQVRVGIETGEAVVALGARPEQGEGIVTGDVVNTASRLQGAAPVNGVAVGQGTYAATRETFELGSPHRARRSWETPAPAGLAPDWRSRELLGSGVERAECPGFSGTGGGSGEELGSCGVGCVDNPRVRGGSGLIGSSEQSARSCY